MIDKLIDAGADVVAHDPEAMENVKALPVGKKISFSDNEYDALKAADALLICTEWGVYRNPDFDKIKTLLNDAVIFDGRNLFDIQEMNLKGYYYSSIGRHLKIANMMTILVTGAAGFLGSHLCDRFTKEGYHVIGMDNLITGRMSNLEHLMKLSNFEFHHHDVSKHIHIPGKLDYILHFASPASPIDYLKIPIQTLKAGSLGIHNCLGLARVKKPEFLSHRTSEVYGDPIEHPQPETYFGNVNPVGPRGVYDEAKRFQEAMTMAYHTFHGVETRIARIFNTYGPRMRLNDGRVLPAFIGQALRGEDLTVFGDGSQTRSFCFVEDLVEGIHRLLHSDYVEPVNIEIHPRFQFHNLQKRL